MLEKALKEHAKQTNQATAALIEAMGMLAENQDRINRGMSPAYDEQSFYDLKNRSKLEGLDLVEKQNDFGK